MALLGFIGHSNILHAELVALFEGLNLIWNMGYKSVVCYTGSQHVVKLIPEPFSKHHTYASLIENIREKMQLGVVKLVDKCLSKDVV